MTWRLSHALALGAAAVVWHLAAAGLDVSRELPAWNLAVAFGSGDLNLLFLNLTFGLAVIAGLWWTRARAPKPMDRAPNDRALWIWAAVHLALVIATRRGVTHGMRFTDDEHAYELQARLMLEGTAAGPALLPRWANPNDFIVYPDGELLWASCYPLMAGLLTVPGMLIGVPNLLWSLLGAALVLHCAKLARQIWPATDTAAIAALLATSPVLIGLGAFKHTALPFALFAVLALRLALSPSGRRTDLGLGCVVGLAVLCRPLDGLWLVAVVTGALVATRISMIQTLERLGWVTLGGTPLAALLLGYNGAVTGSVLTLPYSLLYDGQPVYGFGETFYRTHTVFHALLTTVDLHLMRLNHWALGGSIGIGIMMASLVVARTDLRIAAVLAAWALHVLLYAPAPYLEVSAVGLTYSLPKVVLLTLLLAGLMAHFPSVSRREIFALAVFGWATWVPLEAIRMHRITQVQKAALEAPGALRPEGKLLVLHRGLSVSTYRHPVFSPPPPHSPDDRVFWVFEGDEGQFRQRAIDTWTNRDVLLLERHERPDGPPEFRVTPWTKHQGQVPPDGSLRRHDHQ